MPNFGLRFRPEVVSVADEASADACLRAYERDPQGFGQTLLSQKMPNVG